MPNLNINTGVIRLTINDDPARVIAFNPTDILFAERFYALRHDLEARQADFQQREEALDQETAVDANGLPANLAARIAFMREVCEYMHAQLDNLFGAGTALTVFQGALDLDAIIAFFEGVTPFVEKARTDKLKPYRATRGKKAAMT